MRPLRFLCVSLSLTFLSWANPLFAVKGWEPLKSGDTIDIVWPSSAPTFPAFDSFSKRLDHTVCSYQLGGVRTHLETVSPEDSLGGYYANNTPSRAHFLKEILLDSNTKAIWAGRGGFGADEVVALWEQAPFPFPAKPFIGFSDATYFHLLAHSQKKPTLHGPMAWSVKEVVETTKTTVNQKTSLEPLMNILKGEIQEVCYTLNVLNPEFFKREEGSQFPGSLETIGWNTKVQLPASLETKVLGGNLSVIQRSIGTPTALNPAHSILFLEDTGEAFNRLSSLLTHMTRTHLFDDIDALFLGDLSVSGLPLPKVLKNLPFFSKKPILQSCEFGHGPLNHIIPFGTSAKLEFPSAQKATLTISTNESAYE